MTDDSTASLRVAVSGARGRVGREIVAALEADPGFECVAAVDVGDDLHRALEGAGAQALIDFSVPTAAAANALTAVGQRVRPVVGTTGMGEAALTTLRTRCEAAGLGGCVVPNFALGAALLMWLADLCAGHFESCEIIESHHPGKLDAPSGTALRTAERLLAARGGRPFRHTDPATEPLAGTRGGVLGGAGVHSLRLDGPVADQTVIFGAIGQTLSLEHRTTSRAAFVPGVLAAVRAVIATERFYTSLEEILGLPPAASVLGAMASSEAR
ncbi:MAG TPA: 4-hydroxy-tetrahydrodipicolinate reductase [Candidatus Dormibacteraeota bacterium]|nr:4-hydroxy-tetrahydrodipicolinate reductase [Candidatus Dormibacteraeota bacterium]